MRGQATDVSIRLPTALVERAREAVSQCGMTLREFVGQAAHGALAERLCQHAGRVAEPRAAETTTGDLAVVVDASGALGVPTLRPSLPDARIHADVPGVRLQGAAVVKPPSWLL